MKTEEYWEDAALLREIAVQEGATATAEDVLKLYDEALLDIEKEISIIEYNFRKRFGLDNKTAQYFLTRSQQEENLTMLINALENAPDEQARADILKYINLDGLSVRAYASRIERYNAVKESIYARIKKLASDSITLVGAMLKTVYKESYYGAVDDVAKGLNVGINFGLLNDNAIDEAINTKWHGKRFSERIWDNTDRLADEAQKLVTKALMSGEALNKTAVKLQESFGAEKYHATTLIRTETAHVHAMADMRAYNDLGVEEYKYLATLDYVTCSVCQPLDGMVFKVSEAREGVNYPVMHPRCRCTTTMNINYDKRRARNPITGKNELIDGDVTYNEWLNNMSPEQRNALNLAQKKNSNRTADKLQHEKYKKVLGTKEVPRGFKEFQELKYTNPDKWNELKALYKQKNSVDKSAKSDIIKIRSGSVALENQRYGRNKNTLINKTYIESGEYRRKFDNITQNTEINRVVYSKAKEMLKHRSGTLFEDMYWIDGNTGNIIASALNEKIEEAVAYSKSIKTAIQNKSNLIAIHTHPHSMPPSIADFNSACVNKYSKGVIACHNGKIFCYVSEEEISERLYLVYIEKFLKNGYTEYEAQINTLKKLKENYKIDFWEV